MKIDFNRPLLTLEGKPLQEPNEDGKTLKEVTLKTICASALANSREGSGEEKAKAYDLAIKIIGATAPVEITIEDAAIIKKRMEDYPVIICGQACRMLEQVESKPVKARTIEPAANAR